MQADHGRIDRREARIVQPQSRRQAAAQIVDDGIGLPDKRLQVAFAFVGLDVEGQAALAEVPGLEIFAVAGPEHMRPDAPGRIPAGFGVLDLEDLGAELGEQHGAVGRRAILLDGDDAQIGQGFHQTGFRLMSCLAMIRRCISLVPSPMQVSGASR